MFEDSTRRKQKQIFFSRSVMKKSKIAFNTPSFYMTTYNHGADRIDKTLREKISSMITQPE